MQNISPPCSLLLMTGPENEHTGEFFVRLDETRTAFPASEEEITVRRGPVTVSG